MKTRIALFLAAFVAASVGSQSFAAEPSAPPKPGPEHAKLERYVGRWKFEEVSVPTPLGPAGKASYRSVVKWAHDGFFLEEKGSGTWPMGPYSWTLVTGFNPEKRAFTTFLYDSIGAVGGGTLTIEGDVTTGTWEQPGMAGDGKTYRCKSVMVWAPDRKSGKYTWTYSEDGVTWKPWLEGTGKKTGGK